MGHRGMSSSIYFADRDELIASVLTRTLMETNQEVPHFLEQYKPQGDAANALKFETESDWDEHEAAMLGAAGGGGGEDWGAGGGEWNGNSTDAAAGGDSWNPPAENAEDTWGAVPAATPADDGWGAPVSNAAGNGWESAAPEHATQTYAQPQTNSAW